MASLIEGFPDLALLFFTVSVFCLALGLLIAIFHPEEW